MSCQSDVVRGESGDKCRDVCCEPVSERLDASNARLWAGAKRQVLKRRDGFLAETRGMCFSAAGVAAGSVLRCSVLDSTVLYCSVWW